MHTNYYKNVGPRIFNMIADHSGFTNVYFFIMTQVLEITTFLFIHRTKAVHNNVITPLFCLRASALIDVSDRHGVIILTWCYYIDMVLLYVDVL